MQEKNAFGGFVQKYYYPAILHLWILVQGIFKGLCRNISFWRNINLWPSDNDSDDERGIISAGAVVWLG